MNRHGLLGTTWVKSSHSDYDAGNCLEIGSDIPGFVPIGDSKTPDAPALRAGHGAWSAFLAGVRDDAFAVGPRCVKRAGRS
ncbi:DUF397 domain-containing protein [Streptomyces sp. NPDC059578]|uniref:DUF397 domain-containing protein n=1 Tax=unclassified Streptomyces TaxID=2593676 RepID=UPI003652093A